MKLFWVVFLLLSLQGLGQNSFHAKIIDSKTHEPLTGGVATVSGLQTGNVSDTSGALTITGIPDGTYTLVFSFTGYTTQSRQFIFPLPADSVFIIPLESEAEFDVVTITSMRTNSRIDDTPVKLEVIGQDEIEEMTGIQPSNVSMLLTEASGIQPQLTSATSGNINARIYGLDGSYTQIVKDGFPMYSGFSSGFSIMQIPPLDLRQIEIIKGAASTLYGGDAIAGVINLVTKLPSKTPECAVVLNQTQKFGSDINGYYAQRFGHFGLSFLATENRQRPIDINGDFFTDIPLVHTTTFTPKFYWFFNDTTTLSFSINSTMETRNGGDIVAIEDRPDSLHSYFDRNESNRTYTQLRFDKSFSHGNLLTFKNSVNYFQRNALTAGHYFGGAQFSTYSELSYLLNLQKHALILGGNFLSDAFEENRNINPTPRNYNYSTAGAFVQDDWKLTEKFIVQPGIRADEQNRFGLFLLPRLGAMYKFTPLIVLRAGSGFGYKAPTMFNTGSDELAYSNVRALSPHVEAERSFGVNGDVNIKKYWGDFGMNFNEAFFFVRIDNPLIPNADSLQNGTYYFQNAGAPIQSRGLETNIRFMYKNSVLHCGYTYTDAQQLFSEGIKEAPFVCRHHVLLDFFGEIRSWEIGLEGFYYSPQYLGNGTYGVDYWECAVMLARQIKNVRLLLNVENIFDERQTRHGIVVNQPVNDPSFNPVFMPLNGRIINLSMRIAIH